MYINIEILTSQLPHVISGLNVVGCGKNVVV